MRSAAGVSRVAARKSDVSAKEASLSLSEPPSPLLPPLGSSVRHREKKMSLFSLRRRRSVRRSGENEEEEDDHDEGGGRKTQKVQINEANVVACLATAALTPSLTTTWGALTQGRSPLYGS